MLFQRCVRFSSARDDGAIRKRRKTFSLQKRTKKGGGRKRERKNSKEEKKTTKSKEDPSPEDSVPESSSSYAAPGTPAPPSIPPTPSGRLRDPLGHLLADPTRRKVADQRSERQKLTAHQSARNAPLCPLFPPASCATHHTSAPTRSKMPPRGPECSPNP